METALFANALQFVVHLCIPILGAVLAGAAVSGLVRVLTQIEDSSIALVGKLVSVGVLLSISGKSISQEVFDFAARLWGGTDFFH